MTGNAVINHLWQSTVFLVAAGLAAFTLRRNQASVRHAVWVAASVKFLVPFSLLVSLGGVFAWSSAGRPALEPIAPAIAAAIEPFAETVDAPAGLPSGAVTSGSPVEWRTAALISLWAIGLAGVAVVRIRGWQQIRVALRASEAVSMTVVDVPSLRVRATPHLIEPGIVGIWRQVLLVPAGFERALTRDQLRAIVAHEVHHMRRRDNLTSAIHMAVEGLFWFHPAVWWVGARLIEERERACDEHVLAVGEAPEAYAEGILNVCRQYVESPVACVAGVTGSDLKKRVSSILERQIGSRLTITRRVLLVAAALVALGMPVLAGAIATPTFAEATVGKPTFAEATVGKPTFAEATIGTRTSAEVSATTQKFDVASIRPCEDSMATPGGRRGGVGPVFSPGMLVYNCGTLLQLVHEAFVTNGEPLLNNAPVMRVGAHPIPEIVRGGPDWARTERFMIEAKAAISTGLPGNQAPEREILMGPMLRALLEERFKLVIHREFEKDVPMYALRVAKGGLKIKPAGPDSCIPYDGSQPPPIPMDQEIRRVRDGGKPYCGHGLMGGPIGPNHAWVLNGQKMDGLAWVLSNMMDRHVIDETGVADKFVMYLEYAPDDMVPFDTVPRATDPPTAPSITQVLKSLGLELVSTKAPKQYIVIDHAERPAFVEAGASTSARHARVPLARGVR